MRAEVEAKNAALEAARRAKIEALKIRNWLLGQAMVQNALSQSGLSGREQERVRAEARTKGVSAALGLVNALKQAAQARLAALEARITRMEERLDEAQQSSKSPTVPYPRRPPYPDPETADMTAAERLAEYKQSAAYQARQARYTEYYRQKVYEDFRQREQEGSVPLAQATLEDLGITLDPKFDAGERQTIINGANKLATAMGGSDIFRNELGGVFILKDNEMPYGGLGDKHKVTYNTGSGFDEWRVIHELAHAWDANHGWSLSRELKQKTGGSFSLKGMISYWLGICNPTQPGCNHAGYVWGDVPPKGADGNFDQREDFAESVAAYLDPLGAKNYINEHFPKVKRFQYENFLETARGKFIEELMKRVVAGGER